MSTPPAQPSHEAHGGGPVPAARAVPIWQRAHAELDHLLPDGHPDRLRGDLKALS